MDVHVFRFLKTWTSMFLKHVKHGRPCFLKIWSIECFLKIWSIECFLKSNIECSILLFSSCKQNINNNDALIPTSTSTRASRVSCCSKNGCYWFDLLQWTPPPSSPQQPQPIDEQEDISSIVEEFPSSRCHRCHLNVFRWRNEHLTPNKVQLGCLALSLRFWPKTEQFSASFSQNSLATPGWDEKLSCL